MSAHHSLTRRFVAVGTVVAALWSGLGARGQNQELKLPSAELMPAAILSAMEKVADWQISHPSRHPSTDWTMGAMDAGFMALDGVSGSTRFRDAMLDMGTSNGWALGRRPYMADDHCVGQTYLELFLLQHDPAIIAPLRERFDHILSEPAPVGLEFKGPRHDDRWSWCDALFMGPPTWTRLYAATGDPRFLDFMVTNWWATSDYLYDTNEHLYFRDSTYFTRREANGQKVFWSRGNGWVMAGLVRVLEYLPANHPDRARFVGQFKEMAGRILTLQQPDGLWRSSLLDPASYPLKETSGSGFYTYALAWGVNQSILDRASFEPALRKAWSALVACVTPDGKLTHVQPIGADPKRFDDDSTDVFGVGAYLLAGSEVYHWSALNGLGHLTLRVSNTRDRLLQSSIIEVETNLATPLHLPAGARLAVMDRLTSRMLDSLTTEGHLLFRIDLSPNDTRDFLVFDASVLAARRPNPPIPFPGMVNPALKVEIIAP